jgi:hypothetical protein
MKWFTLAAILVLATTSAVACFQIDSPKAIVYGSTISGRVILSDKSLAHTLVTLHSKGKFLRRTRTNFDGVFEMRNVPEGLYEVLIDRWGKGQILVEPSTKGTYAPLRFVSYGDGCPYVERNG